MFEKILNYINPSRNWEKHQMFVAGIQEGTEKQKKSFYPPKEKDEVVFVVIATANGNLDSKQYLSEPLCAPKDDTVYLGKNNGDPITVLINPQNREQYKVTEIPISQYS
jgi:hypothetical protein